MDKTTLQQELFTMLQSEIAVKYNVSRQCINKKIETLGLNELANKMYPIIHKQRQLDRRSDRYKKAIELKVCKNYTQKRIAKELGLKVNAVTFMFQLFKPLQNQAAVDFLRSGKKHNYFQPFYDCLTGVRRTVDTTRIKSRYPIVAMEVGDFFAVKHNKNRYRAIYNSVKLRKWRVKREFRLLRFGEYLFVIRTA